MSIRSHIYNAALRTNTREFISWGLISRLASKRPQNKLWGRVDRVLLSLSHPTLAARVGTSRSRQEPTCANLGEAVSQDKSSDGASGVITVSQSTSVCGSDQRR